jgi:radical SAM protein with 4Fe4S-binding SPASM domain
MDSEIPRGKRKEIAGKVICGAGLNSICITANGVVWPCMAFPLDIGNLRSTSLKFIWQESKVLKDWRSHTRGDVKTCNDCKYAEICNFCPGISYAENGDALRANDSACRLTHVYANIM